MNTREQVAEILDIDVQRAMFIQCQFILLQRGFHAMPLFMNKEECGGNFNKFIERTMKIICKVEGNH